ncbi:MAG: hypothetical protein JWN74_1427 [Acidobacteriaceae bacterium]|nr:hypothetical protein [Acidobacteriaceae bacterium]
MLGAGFSEHERAVRKIKRRQALPSGQLCSSRAPVKTPGNHQVQHQPEIAFDPNANSFADSPQFAHGSTFHVRNWWLSSTQQKGTGQTYLLDRLTYDPCFERTDVRGNVRKFWHIESWRATNSTLIIKIDHAWRSHG